MGPVKLLLAALAAAAGLIAQNAAQKTESPPADTAKPAASEAAKALPVSVDPKTFTLGPEDVLFVSVWREPQHSGQVVIRPDGKINMPLIKDVPAGGLTPEQLASRIAERLSKFINSPEVTVQVLAVRSKTYLISGEIGRPGRYPLAVPTTIFEALSMAGGFREFANKKKIIIVRGEKRIRFNYNEVVKGKNLQQNILLQNGDQIIVP